MRSEILNVTPQQAEEWLKKNERNRPLMQTRVDTYARDMLADCWRLTHQGVAFTADGTLVDGQHRLAAVVQSGKTVEMLVTHDAPEESRYVVDVHGARKIHDVLTIATGRNYSRLAVAMSRIIHSLGNAHSTTLTVDEIRSLVDTHREGIDWFETNFGQSRTMIFGPIAAGLAYAYPTAPDRVTAFAQHLESGANLSEGSPALVLRNTFIANGGKGRGNAGGDARKHMTLRVLRAIQAYLAGERLKQLAPAVSAYEFFRVYWEKAAQRAALAPHVQPVRRDKKGKKE